MHVVVTNEKAGGGFVVLTIFHFGVHFTFLFDHGP